MRGEANGLNEIDDGGEGRRIAKDAFVAESRGGDQAAAAPGVADPFGVLERDVSVGGIVEDEGGDVGRSRCHDGVE